MKWADTYFSNRYVHKIPLSIKGVVGLKQIHKLEEALLRNLQVLRLIDDPLYLSLWHFRKTLVRYLVLAIQLHQGFRRAIKGLPFFLPVYLPPPRQQHIVIHHLVQPLPFHRLSLALSYARACSRSQATASQLLGLPPSLIPQLIQPILPRRKRRILYEFRIHLQAFIGQKPAFCKHLRADTLQNGNLRRNRHLQ